MTKGCGDTTPGCLYRMHCVRDNGVRYHKDVGRPDVVTKYYDACGVIDHHNHSRQGTLALEEKWPTKDGWTRIFTTMCGIVLTDSWLAMKHYLDEQYGKQNCHPLWNISIHNFGELVSSKILSRHSRTRWKAGQEDIPFLVHTPAMDPDDSENIPSPNEGDSSTGKGVHGLIPRKRRGCGSHGGRTDNAVVGGANSTISDDTITLGPMGTSFNTTESPISLSTMTNGSTANTEDGSGSGTINALEIEDDMVVEYINNQIGKVHRMIRLPVVEKERVRYRCNWCYHHNQGGNHQSSYYCLDCKYAFCFPKPH